MGKDSSFLTRIIERHSQWVWRRRAAGAHSIAPGALRAMRRRARRLKAVLDRFLLVADDRLTIPHIGSTTTQQPKGTDWTWRPDMWRWRQNPLGMTAVPTGTELADGLTIFHDCKNSELTFRQLRNTGADDLAPFGLRLDVFQFDGSFLSVVQDLPKDLHRGLNNSHLIRLSPVIDLEKPLEIFARLNLKHGPNTETLVRELPLHQDEIWVEFDLAYIGFNENRIEHMWVDLIFEDPQNNQITIRDISLGRSPRAQL